MSRLARCHDVEDFRREARRRLPRGIFDFVDRGAERDHALTRNLDAFRAMTLRSEFLVDLSERDYSVDLFGARSALPFAIAPTGAAGLLCPRGELALARAAARLDIPFTLASASLTSMEEIAAGSTGRHWFQFYIWRELDLALEMVERAGRHGFDTLFVTIDTALGRTREYNDRNGFTDPISLNARFLADMARHPGWLLGVMGRYAATTGMPRHANYPEHYQRTITRGASDPKPVNDAGATWDTVRRVRDVWAGPLVVKGVMSGDDARRAVDAGADGVVVSNHGGRAMDAAPASLDVLPEVAAAVGKRTTVLFDGGVRHGADIVKALALGARAVLIGRATLYGIAVGGQTGAEKVLGIIANQFEKNMGYLGCRSVAELGPRHLTAPRGGA